MGGENGLGQTLHSEKHWKESIPYLPFLEMMVVWVFETI
jgi:hypothetical protein